MSQSDITLNTPTGRLLTEVVRAHMHTSLPSSLLGRILVGLDEFILECRSPEDVAMVKQTATGLHVLREAMRVAEVKAYGSGIGSPPGKEKDQ